MLPIQFSDMAQVTATGFEKQFEAINADRIQSYYAQIANIPRGVTIEIKPPVLLELDKANFMTAFDIWNKAYNDAATTYVNEQFAWQPGQPKPEFRGPANFDPAPYFHTFIYTPPPPAPKPETPAPTGNPVGDPIDDETTRPRRYAVVAGFTPKRFDKAEKDGVEFVCIQKKLPFGIASYWVPVDQLPS